MAVLFAPREREIALKEQEYEFKRKEDQRSKWTSPLVLALFGAALAAFGNALVAYINGNAQRELEETRAEAVRILEMIKTNDADKASTNLRFLIEAGLITNPNRRITITTFLDKLDPGSGPVLPSPELQRELQRMLTSLGESIKQHAPDRMSEMMEMLRRESIIDKWPETVKKEYRSAMQAGNSAKAAEIFSSMEKGSPPPMR